MKGISASFLNNLAPGVKVIGNHPVRSPAPITRTEPAGIIHMKSTLDAMKLPYVTEYRFDPKRKFRADIALPDLRLLIEYEGLTKQHQGGHQSIEGYSKNCEKYNLATCQGWHYLRYTNRNYQNLKADLEAFLLKPF